jgi:signal transduction histidine kinase
MAMAATVDQLLEPAVELQAWMTVSDVAVSLRSDEPGFLRKDDGWEAVLPHLLVAQPASRRVIDVPRLSIEAVPHDAPLPDLSAVLQGTTVGSSPVVDGTVLVGRLDHQRLRAWLACNAEANVAAELNQLRLATLGILHDLNSLLMIMGIDAGKHQDPDACETAAQAAKLVRVLQSLHRGASIANRCVDVVEVVTRLLPLARTLSVNVFSVARVELGCLVKAAVHCPPGLIERAIIGLVANASEATFHCGSIIRLDVEADECEVKLRVTDDGPGVADHLVPHLFERGFSTKGSDGRGTGLASLQEEARRAGGDLRFESRPSGASFVLALPRA